MSYVVGFGGLFSRVTPKLRARHEITSSHRGRANDREARSEDEDVCGEYDESERRSIAVVQPAECRGYLVAGPVGPSPVTPRIRAQGAALWVAFLAPLAGTLPGEEPSAAKRTPDAATGGFRFTDISREAGLAGAVTLSGRPGKDHLLDSAGTGAAFL